MKGLTFALTNFLLISCTSNTTHQPSQQRRPASEIDSFSERYEPLPDSTEYINEITNKFFEEALEKANKKGSCDHKRLYKALNKATAGTFFSKIEVAIEEDERIIKRKVSKKDSIFKKIKIYDAPVTGFGIVGSVFNMQGILLGTDKIAHLIDTGFNYFNLAYLKGKGEKAALKYGRDTENGIYGIPATGVYSHADLVANFEGMRFWLNVTDKYIPVKDPYIRCEDGNWVKNKRIDLTKYVNSGMDEGVNCNRFKNSRFSKKVQHHIDFLENLDPRHRYECPVDPDKCVDLLKRYGMGLIAQQIISPLCFDAGLLLLKGVKKTY